MIKLFKESSSEHESSEGESSEDINGGNEEMGEAFEENKFY